MRKPRPAGSLTMTVRAPAAAAEQAARTRTRIDQLAKFAAARGRIAQAQACVQALPNSTGHP